MSSKSLKSEALLAMALIFITHQSPLQNVIVITVTGNRLATVIKYFKPESTRPELMDVG